MNIQENIFKDNIFRRKFHALTLYEWFDNHFPDSFSIQIYKGEDPTGYRYKDRVWSFHDQVEKRGSFYRLKFPTEYTLDTNASFFIKNGCENTYISFCIQDDRTNFYVVSWGYKRCDVEHDYVAPLIALLCNTCYEAEKKPLKRYDFCVVKCKEYYTKIDKEELAAANL